MTNKKVTKTVRFEYYEPVIMYDKDIIHFLMGEYTKAEHKTSEYQELEKLEKLADTKYSERYSLKKILEAIKEKEVKAEQTVLEKFCGIDIKTFSANNWSKYSSMTYFQLVNNRDTNLPSTRREGEERQDIKLNDDEYIGEFMGAIFEEQTSTLMLQLNKYSLTLKEVENFFTQKRYEYLELKGQKSCIDKCKVIKLIPITDKSKVAEMLKAKSISKFEASGNDVSLAALIDNGGSALDGLKTLMTGLQGINFKISISLDARGKKTPSLAQNLIQKMKKAFDDTEEGKRPAITAYYKENENSLTESVNWLIPKMQSRIFFKMQTRTALGYEVVYNEMATEFASKLEEITSINLAKKSQGNK